RRFLLPGAFSLYKINSCEYCDRYGSKNDLKKRILMQILWIERLLQGNGERKENKSNRNDNRFDLEEPVFPELPAGIFPGAGSAV
ncbi:MAG: hypothetical protein ACLT2Q_09575, partial [Lachnospiraceae bacterium]